MPARKPDQPHRHSDPAGYSRWWRAKKKAENSPEYRDYQNAYHARRMAEDPAYQYMKREASKWFRRKKKYGISRNEYDRMHREQNGRCAVCGEFPQANQDLRVDHDHRTGRVRALLCSQCNAMLGLAKENILILERAVLYLRRHGGVDFS